MDNTFRHVILLILRCRIRAISLSIALKPRELSQFILATLENAIAIYRKPQYLMTDNGSWFVHRKAVFISMVHHEW